MISRKTFFCHKGDLKALEAVVKEVEALNVIEKMIIVVFKVELNLVLLKVVDKCLYSKSTRHLSLQNVFEVFLMALENTVNET
jgi:hypothetical protein